MKQLTALLLALILACTLPLLFAFDAAQPNDHDCEHDHEDGLMRVGDPWCSVCGNYTTVQEELVYQGSEDYSDTYHLAQYVYWLVCSTCGTPITEPYYTDSLDAHSFVWYFEDYSIYEACMYCGRIRNSW